MDFQSEPVAVTPAADGFNVKLFGAIHTNVAWIDKEFKKVVEARPKQVDLDLSETTFLSSTGIGSLVFLYNGVKAGGGTVRIVAIQKRVLSILQYCRLADLFQVQSAGVVDG